MGKINILFVITKLELGGAQRQLLTLIKHLDRTRYSLFLFTAGSGLLVQEAAGISGLNLHLSSFLERPINPFKDLLALIELCRFIRRKKIGIVHTHSSKAGLLGRWAAALTGTRVVHTVHGWSFNDYQPAVLREIYTRLERITARFTDRLLVISDYDRRKGLQCKIGKAGQYTLVRHGIDPGEFNLSGAGVREEFGLGKQDLIVCMVACLKPQKCPQDFVKFASLVGRELPEVKFFLVGDGVLRKSVEELVRSSSLQPRVILTGWRRDIPRLLSAADLFVLTSLWEGLPISVLEAMLSGKPVVATQTGGISEVISDGETGFLFPPHRIAEMAEKATALLRDGGERRKVGEKARHVSGIDFAVDKMVRNTEALYDEIYRGEES